MFRRLVFLIVAAFLLGQGVSTLRAAQAFVIADMQTGYVLASHNADQRLQIASLTKVASAMVVLDWVDHTNGDLTEVAVVPQEAFAFGGPNPMNLRAGDRMTLRDLLYASLLQSDNISAYTMAQYVGDRVLRAGLTGGRTGRLSGVDAFVLQMNALAEKLNMSRTQFLNPYGGDWEERRPPYSTAADLVRLTRYAMARASFRFFVSQKQRRITIQGIDGEREYLLRNTNELLGQQGIEGVKTGRTRRAGDCLILTADRSPLTEKVGEETRVTPRRIGVVLLGSSDRFGQGQALVNRGWGLYDDWLLRGRPMAPGEILE